MDTQKQGYKVYVGGRWGKQISHGKLLGKIFTDEAEIMKTIEKRYYSSEKTETLEKDLQLLQREQDLIKLKKNF